MTEIVLAHDQKHVPGHYFSVGPNASPKRNPNVVGYDVMSCAPNMAFLINSANHCSHWDLCYKPWSYLQSPNYYMDAVIDRGKRT